MEMLAFDGDGQRRFVTHDLGIGVFFHESLVGSTAVIQTYKQHILSQLDQGRPSTNEPILVVQLPGGGGPLPHQTMFGVVTNRKFIEAMYLAHAERFGPDGPTDPEQHLRFRVRMVLREDTPVDILAYLNRPHQSNVYSRGTQ
jgi:hypothetical protein